MTCPYCTSDNEAVRDAYYDQTCAGCVFRMGLSWRKKRRSSTLANVVMSVWIAIMITGGVALINLIYQAMGATPHQMSYMDVFGIALVAAYSMATLKA